MLQLQKAVVPEMLRLLLCALQCLNQCLHPSTCPARAVFILNGTRNTIVDALQAQRTPHVVPV